MPITEEEQQKRKDKANSYKTMMESWAWKDFYAELERKEKFAINDWINEGGSAEVNRGIALCIQGIKEDLQRILNP